MASGDLEGCWKQNLASDHPKMAHSSTLETIFTSNNQKGRWGVKIGLSGTLVLDFLQGWNSAGSPTTRRMLRGVMIFALKDASCVPGVVALPPPTAYQA
eukprot:1141771-Pelagomonas_calceolata.AAC.4